MASRNITLTNTPQEVTAVAAFIESKGGMFNFWFSDTAPVPALVYPHTNSQSNHINYDGSKGKMWAWVGGGTKVILTVS